MKRGTVLHHKSFRYKDGESSPKYLILLNTPSPNEPFVVVRVTSQQKEHRPKHPGCIEGKNLFFIEAGKTLFPLDSWVQLWDFYEVTHKRFQIDYLKEQKIDIVGDLPEQIVNELINCAKRSDDISQYQLGLIATKRNKVRSQ